MAFSPSDLRPISVTLPAFALDSLCRQAGEWANSLNHNGQHEAAEKWYQVEDALKKAISYRNITRSHT